MDHKYYIVRINGATSDVEEFEGNEWKKVYERLVKLRNSKSKSKVIVIRGMEIERFETKK